MLGFATAAMVTLAFLVPFGIAGSLLAVLFVAIFGVPSSAGPYAVDMLPGFFRFLAEWLPLRYVTDGARALVFFDGDLQAGLGTAAAPRTSARARHDRSSRRSARLLTTRSCRP